MFFKDEDKMFVKRALKHTTKKKNGLANVVWIDFVVSNKIYLIYVDFINFNQFSRLIYSFFFKPIGRFNVGLDKTRSKPTSNTLDMSRVH